MRAEVQETTGGRGLRVCVYLRMSDDEQQLSIERQRAEVRRFCAARGWVIVREYIDEGKSGSKEIAKREDFHRLIADAHKGQWNAVVCYNTSRFGRLNSLDGAQYKRELAKHGIYLETVTEGRIDWRTSLGRIQDAILSEQNNSYSLNLSADAISGRMKIAEMGYWATGQIPFGYDRQFVDGSTVQMTIPRLKPFKKPRNWHTRLVVNEEEAATVREIFRRFVSTDISIRQLAAALNRDGIQSPGKAWQVQSLKNVLSDHAYIGVFRFGYSRRTREAHGRVQQTEIPNACPVIIERPQFDKVQAKLQQRRDLKANASQARAGALSGILVCGHCGYRMDKRARKNGNQYVCSSANRRQHLGCKGWGVQERDILPLLARELLSAVDFELIERTKAKPAAKGGAEVATLRKTVEQQAKQYERARANLLLADTEIFAAMQADVLRLKGELDKARNSLAVLESDAGKSAALQFSDWWRTNRDRLVDVTVPQWEASKPNPQAGMFASAGIRRTLQTVTFEPEGLRDLLKALNATLTLHWTPKGERYHELTTGVLKAEISGETVSQGLPQGEHVSNERSNTRSHARSRDRG